MVPYTASAADLSDDSWAENITGWFQVIILARSASDFDTIRKEISNLQAQYNSSLKDYKLVLYDQPDTQLELEIKGVRAIGPDKTRTIVQYLLIIVILLLVPAINLSGMTLSRMRSRLPEDWHTQGVRSDQRPSAGADTVGEYVSDLAGWGGRTALLLHRHLFVANLVAE